MNSKTWNRIAIGAVVLLAPGGFVLGAGLAARAWQARRARRREAGQEAAGASPPRPEDRPQEEPR